jgi:5-methyltetrahydropteroyltriglutamate--homocysteine methyltransferase
MFTVTKDVILPSTTTGSFPRPRWFDVLTTGDFHCDEDLAGRSWHHDPLQRWSGLQGGFCTRST